MTRHFNAFDQYSEYYNEREHRANDVDIVEYNGAKKPHTDADGEFTCKNRQTAIKRFAKATGWEWALIEAECPVFAKNLSTDCDSVTAEEVEPGVWYVAARYYKDAAPAETETAAETPAGITEAAAAVIENKPARSAWARGVKAYALELLDNLAELTADQLADPTAVRAALLNGAEDWQEYSGGGCSLIYSGDIAERLCTPSELKRAHNGERRPNSRETWLDVQARALFQAARLDCEAIGEVIA